MVFRLISLYVISVSLLFGCGGGGGGSGSSNKSDQASVLQAEAHSALQSLVESPSFTERLGGVETLSANNIDALLGEKLSDTEIALLKEEFKSASKFDSQAIANNFDAIYAQVISENTRQALDGVDLSAELESFNQSPATYELPSALSSVDLKIFSAEVDAWINNISLQTPLLDKNRDGHYDASDHVIKLQASDYSFWSYFINSADNFDQAKIDGLEPPEIIHLENYYKDASGKTLLLNFQDQLGLEVIDTTTYRPIITDGTVSPLTVRHVALYFPTDSLSKSPLIYFDLNPALNAGDVIVLPDQEIQHVPIDLSTNGAVLIRSAWASELEDLLEKINRFHQKFESNTYVQGASKKVLQFVTEVESIVTELEAKVDSLLQKASECSGSSGYDDDNGCSLQKLMGALKPLAADLEAASYYMGLVESQALASVKHSDKWDRGEEYTVDSSSFEKRILLLLAVDICLAAYSLTLKALQKILAVGGGTALGELALTESLTALQGALETFQGDPYAQYISSELMSKMTEMIASCTILKKYLASGNVGRIRQAAFFLVSIGPRLLDIMVREEFDQKVKERARIADSAGRRWARAHFALQRYKASKESLDRMGVNVSEVYQRALTALEKSTTHQLGQQEFEMEEEKRRHEAKLASIKQRESSVDADYDDRRDPERKRHARNMSKYQFMAKYQAKFCSQIDLEKLYDGTWSRVITQKQYEGAVKKFNRCRVKVKEHLKKVKFHEEKMVEREDILEETKRERRVALFEEFKSEMTLHNERRRSQDSPCKPDLTHWLAVTPDEIIRIVDEENPLSESLTEHLSAFVHRLRATKGYVSELDIACGSAPLGNFRYELTYCYYKEISGPNRLDIKFLTFFPDALHTVYKTALFAKDPASNAFVGFRTDTVVGDSALERYNYHIFTEPTANNTSTGVRRITTLGQSLHLKLEITMIDPDGSNMELKDYFLDEFDLFFGSPKPFSGCVDESSWKKKTGNIQLN